MNRQIFFTTIIILAAVAAACSSDNHASSASSRGSVSHDGQRIACGSKHSQQRRSQDR